MCYVYTIHMWVFVYLYLYLYLHVSICFYLCYARIVYGISLLILALF